MQHHSYLPKGFTLIELILGMVVFSIVMVIVMNLMVPQATRAVKPIQLVRGTELGQSVLNEILGKAFDEQSDMQGGRVRCNEDFRGDNSGDPPDGDLNDPGERSCTPAANFGPDGEGRAGFDDVDDYHGLSEAGDAIKNSLGEGLSGGAELYRDFSVSVSVIYDGNQNGVDNGGTPEQLAKLISVAIDTPDGTTLNFSAYRFNY